MQVRETAEVRLEWDCKRHIKFIEMSMSEGCFSFYAQLELFQSLGKHTWERLELDQFQVPKKFTGMSFWIGNL